VPNGAGRDIPSTLNNPFNGIIWELNPEGWQTIAGGRGGEGGGLREAAARGGMHPRGVPACRVRMNPRLVMTEPPRDRAMVLLNVGLVEEFWHPFGVRGLRAPGVRWSVPVARTDPRLPSVSPAG